MKYMKMAAIALMAFALFSCNNKKNEPKCEDAVLRICINDSELRALEGAVNEGDKTACMTDVTLTINGNETITLTKEELADAKNLSKGYKKDISYVVNTVSLTANGKIDDNTKITSLQGKIIKTDGIAEADYGKVIPLAAESTSIEISTEGDKTVYTVTLEPKPAVARLEVFGKISPKPNGDKQAFESITVEHVYVNHYLSTIAGDRYMNVTNGKDGFANDPALEEAMNDAIADTDLADFVAGNKVAGYQLFPKKAAEKAEGEFFDHVILKLNIKYTQAALDAKPELKDMTQRYVTIVRFMKSETKDLDGGFLAGTVYKLNLDELSKDFKTGDDGKPDPNNPDTPDPEPNQKKQLVVKVKPYEWKAQTIKPDVNGGYKK